ncbi:hypothetical protein BK022_13255 [Methylorubrum extorquens]|uniref:TauD/TfdA-like domain-containing protein n=1 Tax=Methylorubrum extorquens TaxID=408 RepID=A0A1S1P5A3_METEX|nr:hypothetical protein BK022_13255 [Methylorubrum extorquens]
MTALPQTILTPLARYGWATHDAVDRDEGAVLRELGRIGEMLGARIAGRAGAIEETIRPQASDDAHPRSLSAQFGLNALPFHAELSHRPRPCRYLLLGCLNPGSSGAATMLLDWRTLDFTADELGLLESAPVLVRTGRRSFYSTLLSPDHAFLRYDPGCLEAVDARGRYALDLVRRRLGAGLSEVHHWRRGDILVIDNWRTLHGRAPSRPSSGRRLARMLIDA